MPIPAPPPNVNANALDPHTVSLVWDPATMTDTRVAIAAGDIAEYHGDKIPTKARLYASKSFKAADWTLVQHGSWADEQDFFQDFDAEMNGDWIRVLAGVAYSTTDSDQPGVTYDLDIYDEDGMFLCHALSRLRIPPTPNPTTWDAIIEYSKSVFLKSPPTYMSSDVIEARLASLVSP